MTTPAGLTCEALSWGPRPNVTLVENVHLSIAPGERLVIVGPNGAGKSSLIALLCGRQRPHSGTVRVGSRDLNAFTRLERARLIAHLSQSDIADRRLTVSEYVALGRLPHQSRVTAGTHAGVVEAAIGEVGLAALGKRRLGSLSGGERQRAVLARVFAQEPAILFLDEPTNHLDPRARADLLDLIRAKDMTVVAVLHDLALVEGFADRVAVMAGGRVVACGAPADVLAPAIVRDVFAMDVLRLAHPGGERSSLVFERPHPPLPLRVATIQRSI